MILKLYKDKAENWCFDFKQTTYLVVGDADFLNKLANLLEKNILYFKITDFPHAKYLMYITEWCNRPTHTTYYAGYGLFKNLTSLIENCARDSMLIDIFPKLESRISWFITSIRWH